MVDNHDGIVHGVIDIIRVTHVSTRVLAYKMYYSLCWTQRCLIHYCTVSVQVMARTYKSSVFFECVVDRRSDDCCGLFVSSCIHSATLKYFHSHKYEQDSIAVPMKFTLQSTENEAYANHDYFYCGKHPLFVYRWFYMHMYVYSPLFCDSCQILAMNALSWSAVQRWAFIFLLTYCSISRYDKPWPSRRDSEESKRE